MQTFDRHRHVGVGHRLHLLDVRAGGEHPLTAVDDDGRDIVTDGGLAGALLDLVLHLEVERIHLRAVQPDRPDAVGDLKSHKLTHH